MPTITQLLIFLMGRAAERLARAREAAIIAQVLSYRIAHAVLPLMPSARRSYPVERTALSLEPEMRRLERSSAVRWCCAGAGGGSPNRTPRPDLEGAYGVSLESSFRCASS